MLSFYDKLILVPTYPAVLDVHDCLPLFQQCLHFSDSNVKSVFVNLFIFMGKL